MHSFLSFPQYRNWRGFPIGLCKCDLDQSRFTLCPLRQAVGTGQSSPASCTVAGVLACRSCLLPGYLCARHCLRSPLCQPLNGTARFTSPTSYHITCRALRSAPTADPVASAVCNFACCIAPMCDYKYLLPMLRVRSGHSWPQRCFLATARGGPLLGATPPAAPDITTMEVKQQRVGCSVNAKQWGTVYCTTLLMGSSRWPLVCCTITLDKTNTLSHTV